MNRGNYTSKLIEWLNASVPYNDPTGAAAVRNMHSWDLGRSPVFALPEDGRIFPKTVYPQSYRMPFHTTVLEYTSAAKPVVLFVYDRNYDGPRLKTPEQYASDTDGLAFQLWYREPSGLWATALCLSGLLIPDADEAHPAPAPGRRNMKGVLMPLPLANERGMTLETADHLRPHNVGPALAKHGGDLQKVRAEQRLLATGIQATLAQFISALECRNVRIDDEPIDPKLQKSRRLRGKPPLKDYKVLTLTTEPKMINTTSGNGTHAAPRMHLRRGHIRRLPKGNIWVNSTVVNPTAAERLDKSYRFKEPA